MLLVDAAGPGRCRGALRCQDGRVFIAGLFEATALVLSERRRAESIGWIEVDRSTRTYLAAGPVWMDTLVTEAPGPGRRIHSWLSDGIDYQEGSHKALRVPQTPGPPRAETAPHNVAQFNGCCAFRPRNSSGSSSSARSASSRACWSVSKCSSHTCEVFSASTISRIHRLSESP